LGCGTQHVQGAVHMIATDCRRGLKVMLDRKRPAQVLWRSGGTVAIVCLDKWNARAIRLSGEGLKRLSYGWTRQPSEVNVL
jgi:tagatose-1,6-bisphosphate aldolase